MKYDVPFSRPDITKGIVTVHADNEEDAKRKALVRLEQKTKEPRGIFSWRQDIIYDRSPNTAPYVFGAPTLNSDPEDRAWINDDWLEPCGEKGEKGRDVYKRGKIHSFSFSPVSGLHAKLLTGYKGKEEMLDFKVKGKHAIVSYFMPYTGEEVVLLDKEVYREGCYHPGQSNIDNKAVLILYISQGEFFELEFLFNERTFELREAGCQ